jgi:nitroreductase
MKKNNLYKKILVMTLFFLFVSTSSLPALENSDIIDKLKIIKKPTIIEEYQLPDPQFIDMSLEKSIMRRMSMRNFTEHPVTDEELSTILWAAYGLRGDGNHTIASINGSYAVVIYVLLEDVYKYNPINHSLVFYKEGDYRDIVGWQYHAPVQLGLCWNTDKADVNFGSAECGAVGQNIYFAANAIGLGTVITAQKNPAIEPVGIPSNEKGVGVMPIGHIEFSYNFKYRPMLISLLPRIKFSDLPLTSALENRKEVKSWESNNISRKDISYLIWASYGYSYYLDKSGTNKVKRHHTIPSAHGYYPFRIYAVTKSGISRYVYGIYNIDLWGLPVVAFLFTKIFGDKRLDLAEASESFVADAPLCIIPVLDIKGTNKWDDLSDKSVRWIWYYEAGASSHNVLLQATSLGLSGNIVPINDKNAICSMLGLKEDKFDPMCVIPVGK